MRKYYQQIPRSSSKRKFVAQTNGIQENDEFVQEESLSSMPNRYKTMLKSVQSCGDYEKMMQGAYENYLTIKFKDIKMKNVSNAIHLLTLIFIRFIFCFTFFTISTMNIINYLGTEWERMAPVF